MGIFSWLFRSRDKPTNSYHFSGWPFVFGKSAAGKSVNEFQPCPEGLALRRRPRRFMPVSVFWQSLWRDCHCMCMNIEEMVRSECRGIRSIFFSTIRPTPK